MRGARHGSFSLHCDFGAFACTLDRARSKDNLLADGGTNPGHDADALDHEATATERDDRRPRTGTLIAVSAGLKASLPF